MRRLAAQAACCLALASPSLGETAREVPPPVEDPADVDPPAFPGVRYRDAVRIGIGALTLPTTDFDAEKTALYRPNLRVRVTVPVHRRAVLRVTGNGSMSLYDFRGSTNLFGRGPSPGEPFDELYDGSLDIQGAVQINDTGHLLLEGERWALIGSLNGRARWEKGEFGKSLSEGFAIALGYELPGRVRLSLGAAGQTGFGGGGIGWSPVFSVRWDVTDDLTVRNRGRGIQIEYRLTPLFEVFATSFVTSQTFRLGHRPGLPGLMVLDDEQVYAGLGFEWRMSRHLRLNVQAGVVPSRRLRVVQEDIGTLSSLRGDVGGYLDFRFDVRP